MNRIYIIAEAGVNHNGNINIAKKLIDVAVEAGVDAIKFQTFKTENIVTQSAKKANYQKETTDINETQFEMIKKLELDAYAHQELISYCTSKEIQFLSTPFDSESIILLDQLGLDTFKVPSGEITNLPYLKQIGKLNKNVILSTGMANLSEIEDALKLLTQSGTEKDNITVLHANTEYPTPMEDVNLKAMLTIGENFGVNIGYSDHTLGIEVPIAAVALGATVIEKHFTLDRNLEGPDHKASLEPDELKAMVKSIRNIENAVSGDGIKQPSASEQKNIKIARKSIHLSRDVSAGMVISESDIIPLRPGDGISPMNWDRVIGKTVARDLKKFKKLHWNDLS